MIESAKEWLRAFSKEPLNSYVFTDSLKPILKAYVRLANTIPWKVRLVILVTGKIPTSYLEEHLHDD